MARKHTVKPVGRAKRWLMAILTMLVAMAMTVAPAGSVKARTDQSYFAAPPAAGYPNIGWSQIKSTTDAQAFFRLPDGNQRLIYRDLINGEWVVPTGDNDAGLSSEVAALVGHGNKVRVQIFRSNPDPSAAEYQDPLPSDHRNLTLAAGKFSETTAANSAATTALETPFGLPKGVGLAIDAMPVIGQANLFASAFDGIFGGNDQKGQWVFVGDTNQGVQQVLTCSDGGANKSNLVYVGSQKPIVTALKSGDLGDSEHIANVDHIWVAGRGFIGRAFDSNALSGYLCPKGQSKAGFDTLCNDKLQLPTCVSDKKGLLDALGGLFNPLQWALDQVQHVVTYFMGFVVDGLRQITDIGNLASDSGVTAAWKVMRDLANVLFILILGAIAFSTILRIDTQRYGLRSLLPRLVAAVIGVNFSLLFVTVLVDTATVLGNPFLSGINILLDQNPVSNTDSLIGGASGVGASVVMIIASLVVIVVLIGLLLLLVVRIVMIWLLAAFAPFAFLFSVLPFSRSLAMQWLKQLIKWVYMAPIAYIVLWIGARFLSAADSLGGEILGILVFIGVCVAAILIPLKLGGEIMQRASAPGSKLARGGAGALARRTGVPAAMKQMRDASERRAAYRGAGLRERASGAMSRLSGGRLGTEGRIEAETQRSAALESEASNLERQFPGEDLDRLDTELAESGKPENNRMRQAVAMARDIRSGAFEARRGGEKAAMALRNFQLQGPEQQAAEIGALGERGVQQFPRQVLHGLVEQRSPLLQQLPEGALRGIVQQNDPEKVRDLREAHRRNLLNPGVVSEVQSWGPDDRARWDRLILQQPQRGQGPQGPGGGQPGGGNRVSSTGGTGTAGEEAPKRISLPEERRTKDEPPNPDDIRKP